MSFSTTVINGELDLVTAPQAVLPGRLTAVSNYEVARQRGIRRVDGFERYDGGASPSAAGQQLNILIPTSFPYPGMAVGDFCRFDAFGNSNTCTIVTFSAAQGGTLVSLKLDAPLAYSIDYLNANISGAQLTDETIPALFSVLTSASGGFFPVGIPAPTNLLLQALPSAGDAPSVLRPGTTYTFGVTAVNAVGESLLSSTTAVTTSSAVATTVNGSITLSGGVAYIVHVALPSAFTLGDWVFIGTGGNEITGEVALVSASTITISLTDAVVLGNPALIPPGTSVIHTQFIQMIWDAPVVPSNVSPLTGYNVYGRVSGSLGFLANALGTLTNNIPYYIDGGFVAPGHTFPTVDTTGSIGSYLDDLNTYYNTIRATIQQVPGQGNVNGLFWLRDQLYATRDYFALNFDTGNTQPNIGDTIYQGASFVTATWKGVVAKQVVISGSWATSNDALGILMVYNTTGAIVNGTALKNHTQSDVSFATARTSGLGNANSTAAGLYVAQGFRGSTPSTASWQWCDLGWVVQYKNCANDFIDMNVALSLAGTDLTSQYQTTSWKVATAFTGGAHWNVGGGFNVSHLSDPTTTPPSTFNYWDFFDGSQRQTTQLVTISGFGFTNQDIPSTASITGIEVQLNYTAFGYTVGGYSTAPIEQTIQFVNVAHGPTPNLASSTPYPVVNVVGSIANPPTVATVLTKLWGTPTNVANTPTQLLGYTGITPVDILSANFGLSIGWQQANMAVFNQRLQVVISYMAVRVSYIPQTNLIYFWNVGATSPSAVKAQVVMHYQQGGTLALGNASGTVYFQFIQANGTVGGIPSRPIGSDEQIRTMPANGTSPDGGAADGSTLLALTSVAADMNSMDWSALMLGAVQPDGETAPPSKYQSITKNFYASSGLEAIYGVSGGGPAFYFDGIKTDTSGNVVPGNFSRILTGLPLRFETPRSIEAHQSHVFLGYFSGVIQWGNAENVLSFDPALYDGTAGTNGFGERVIGIKSINGDSLCVWTQSTIQMMQGNFNIPPGSLVTSSLYTTTISPTSGGIEYTIQPMANYMYCDFRGITAIGATQKYGDFELGHYSSVIAPFIIPRVQLSSFFEGPNIGIINSVLKRNKNMAQYFFADATALSMTFLEDNEPPQFTIQNYTNAETDPLTWDVIQAFTESLGRDRIFGATADGTGYVYEIDRGNSFDSAAVTGFASLVPDTAQTPYVNKEFRGISIFGQAQDYASFTLSRSPDYVGATQQTGLNTINQAFGSLTATPTGNVTPYVSYGTAPLSIEGTAINLRFDSSSATQFPHLIQAVSYNIAPLQEKEE